MSTFTGETLVYDLATIGIRSSCDDAGCQITFSESGTSPDADFGADREMVQIGGSEEVSNFVLFERQATISLLLATTQKIELKAR